MHFCQWSVAVSYTHLDVYKRQVVDYVRTKFKLSTEKKNTSQSAMYGPVEDIAPYHTPCLLYTSYH